MKEVFNAIDFNMYESGSYIFFKVGDAYVVNMHTYETSKELIFDSKPHFNDCFIYTNDFKSKVLDYLSESFNDESIFIEIHSPNPFISDRFDVLTIQINEREKNTFDDKKKEKQFLTECISVSKIHLIKDLERLNEDIKAEAIGTVHDFFTNPKQAYKKSTKALCAMVVRLEGLINEYSPEIID